MLVYQKSQQIYLPTDGRGELDVCTLSMTSSCEVSSSSSSTFISDKKEVIFLIQRVDNSANMSLLLQGSS